VDVKTNERDEQSLELELAWVNAAIEDAHRSGWGELLTCWLWEIAAESAYNRD
jgi:hypothetical protein